MGFSRRQLGKSLLVRISTQVLIANLVSFFIAFRVLPTMSRSGREEGEISSSRPNSPARLLSSAAPSRANEGEAAEFTCAMQPPEGNMFKTITLDSKTKAMAPMFNATTGGSPQAFTATQWVAWKSQTSTWFQDIGLPGFINFAEELLILNGDGTFAPLFPGARQLSAIVLDVDLQRHTLVTLSKHVWTIPDFDEASVKGFLD